MKKIVPQNKQGFYAHLTSMGWQRVGRELMTEQQQQQYIHDLESI